MAQSGKDVWNEDRPFEAPERAKADSRRLRIAAASAGTERGEIPWGWRPAILGLQDGDAGGELRGRSLRAAC